MKYMHNYVDFIFAVGKHPGETRREMAGYLDISMSAVQRMVEVFGDWKNMANEGRYTGYVTLSGSQDGEEYQQIFLTKEGKDFINQIVDTVNNYFNPES